MPSKIIIIATIILFIVSFSVLFVIEAKNHDYDYKKSWSAVYFENSRDDSLDFAIENHEGDDASFDYKIYVDDKKVIGNSAEIKKGATQKISPILDKRKGLVVIFVNHDGAEYSISKNIK